MMYLVAKPYSPRGSGRGECINNGRQALPSLVRPRFLPGDQKRLFRLTGIRRVERSNFFLGDATSSRVLLFRRPQPNTAARFSAPPDRLNSFHAEAHIRSRPDNEV